jgi:hypothetical protein
VVLEARDVTRKVNLTPCCVRSLGHTLGALEVVSMNNPKSGPRRYYLDRNKTRFVVANARLGELQTMRGEICTLASDDEPNARLIAAAPDLLAALRECVVVTSHGPEFAREPEILERALAALSKATFWTHPYDTPTGLVPPEDA